MKHIFCIVTIVIALILMAGCISDAEARDGSGSFYERSTGTKHTFILENGGKNGYYFMQTKEDLERIRKSKRSVNSFQQLINNQKSKKATVAPKKPPSTDTKSMSAFERALNGAIK